MAIEHFERPFTDEEKDTLVRQIYRLEQPRATELLDVFEPLLLLPPFQWLERFLDNLTSWLLVPVLVLVFTARFCLGSGLLIGLALVVLRIVYPRHVQERRKYRERDEHARKLRLEKLRVAQIEGLFYSAQVTTDTFVELEWDDICAGEYLAGFCRVAENDWLLLSPVEDWCPEIVLSWHAGFLSPHWTLSAGDELTPIAERAWPESLGEDHLQNGALFALTLEELLVATPEMFEKAWCGNIFDARVL